MMIPGGFVSREYIKGVFSRCESDTQMKGSIVDVAWTLDLVVHNASSSFLEKKKKKNNSYAQHPYISVCVFNLYAEDS